VTARQDKHFAANLFGNSKTLRAGFTLGLFLFRELSRSRTLSLLVPEFDTEFLSTGFELRVIVSRLCVVRVKRGTDNKGRMRRRVRENIRNLQLYIA